MTLEKACELGEFCGLLTVGEAVRNVELHATSLFVWGTIDRIDPFGNYEPSNCRWVSMKVQNNNKRSNYGKRIVD